MNNSQPNRKFQLKFLNRPFGAIAVLSLVALSVSSGLWARQIAAAEQMAQPTVLANEQIKFDQIQTDQAITKPIKLPRIQLAILLDTSSSMDGLIDQTRNQLWQVVNEFSSAKQNGLTPILEVALYEYGNDGLAQSSGYIRQLNGFTRELDKVSEGLFQLTTNGGSEYCGAVIKTAVTSLQWSSVDSDLKTIFIAGNEPFTQGPVAFQEAIALAKKQGITVNTIFAGQHQQGVQTGWHNGAILAGGDYMSIDANQTIAHIEAPQDKVIAELNQSLNKTYLPYGQQGKEKARRQVAQDEQSSEISGALLASRVKSKTSSFYDNRQWDLVDAVNGGEIGEAELAEMDEQLLPEAMQKLDVEKRKDYVLTQAKEREQIKSEIAALSQQRDVFVAEKLKNQAAALPSVHEAMTKAVIKQAEEKAFKLSQQEKPAQRATQQE